MMWMRRRKKMSKSLNERVEIAGVRIVVPQLQLYMNRAWRRKEAKKLLLAKRKHDRRIKEDI